MYFFRFIPNKNLTTLMRLIVNSYIATIAMNDVMARMTNLFSIPGMAQYIVNHFIWQMKCQYIVNTFDVYSI